MDKPLRSAWFPHWHASALGNPSTLFLLVANLIPLLGVAFWGWDLFLLMMLYWSETAIIGFWHILRMALETKFFAIFLVPFFCVHFGGFMTVHLMLLMGLFGKGHGIQIHSVKDYVDQVLIGANLWIPFTALFISHGISFFIHTLKPRMDQDFGLAPATLGTRTLDPGDLMAAPYRRVIVMHLTLLFGGFLSLALHLDKAAFFLMVALKTAVDLGAHTRKNIPVAVRTAPAPVAQGGTAGTE